MTIEKIADEVEMFRVHYKNMNSLPDVNIPYHIEDNSTFSVLLYGNATSLEEIILGENCDINIITNKELKTIKKVVLGKGSSLSLRGATSIEIIELIEIPSKNSKSKIKLPNSDEVSSNESPITIDKVSIPPSSALHIQTGSKQFEINVSDDNNGIDNEMLERIYVTAS